MGLPNPKKLVRLYDPESSGAELTPRTTLSEFFEDWVIPQLLVGDAAARNVAQYRESVGYWVAATGDPPLGQTDSETCRVFAEHLRRRTGRDGPIRAITRRKHIAAIQRILVLAGPRTLQLKNPVPAGLFGENQLPPYIPQPKRETRARKPAPTPEEIAQWLDACRYAKAPQLPGVAAPDYWRALIAFCYLTGARRSTARAACYSWLRPYPPGAYLRAPPHAMKGRQGRAIYVPELAVRAVNTIAQPDDRDQIFPWLHCERYFDNTITKMQAAADMPRRITLQNLRQANATQLALIHGTSAAQLQLGHSSAAITVEHYLSCDIVIPALERLQIPESL